MKALLDYYLEYQLECLSLRPNWLPRPLSRKVVCPPPEPKGGGNTHWRVMGRGEPSRTTGEKACHSVYSVLRCKVKVHEYLMCEQYKLF